MVFVSGRTFLKGFDLLAIKSFSFGLPLALSDFKSCLFSVLNIICSFQFDCWSIKGYLLIGNGTTWAISSVDAHLLGKAQFEKATRK
jgi:hypothetical protein